jgi:uncharacterized protein
MTKRKSSHRFFKIVCAAIICQAKVLEMHDYIQHGSTSCLLHCIAVAYFSYRIARFFKINKFRIYQLIRGAILHDYFLYDWHEGSPPEGLHGVCHPRIALRNAERDFTLSCIERDIIEKHMFPLTLSRPRYFESALVCIVDKLCSVYEYLNVNAYEKSFIGSLAAAPSELAA